MKKSGLASGSKDDREEKNKFVKGLNNVSDKYSESKLFSLYFLLDWRESHEN